MALSGAALGTAIESAIVSLSPTDKTDLNKIWTAIGNAIVAHIKSAGVVSVNVTTTGSAAAQTGTGTGTIT